MRSGVGSGIYFLRFTGFAGKDVIPNKVRNPSGVNRKRFTIGMLRFAQHDSV